MPIIVSQIEIEKIVELAQENGLSRFEVAEAILVNSLKPYANEDLQEVMRLKLELVAKNAPTASKIVTATENYLLNLPGEIVGVMDLLIESGTMHFARAHANWEVIEKIVVEHDPIVAAYKERGVQEPSGTRH